MTNTPETTTGTINITIEGSDATCDTQTIAYLLADFLSNIGFVAELNVLDKDFDFEQFEEQFVDRLEGLEATSPKVVVNEVLPTTEATYHE